MALNHYPERTDMFFSGFDVLLDAEALLAALALLGFVLPLLLVAGLAGISCFASWAGYFTSKAFADKLARQVASFGVIILGLWLLLVSARWGMWAASWWPVGNVGRGFYPLFFDVPGHLALAAALASILLARVWRRSNRSTVAHLALGGMAAVLWLGSMAAFVAGLFWHQGHEGHHLRLSLDGLTMVLADPLPWMIWAQSIFLGLAAGGGFALVYLLARRNREDFGRDYYGWAVQRCSWWAIIPGVIQAGLATAVFWRAASTQTMHPALGDAGQASQVMKAMLDHPVMPALAVFLFLAVLAWICLLPVLKSRTPLRMKGWMLMHVLLTALSVTAMSRMHVGLWG